MEEQGKNKVKLKLTEGPEEPMNQIGYKEVEPSRKGTRQEATGNCSQVTGAEVSLRVCQMGSSQQCLWCVQNPRPELFSWSCPSDGSVVRMSVSPAHIFFTCERLGVL